MTTQDKYDKLLDFMRELASEEPHTFTTPTGRYGGDEDHDTIAAYWVEDAKDMLEEIGE